MHKTRQLQCALLALACSASLGVMAQTAPVKNIDVPPGELAQAVEALRKQTGGQILYRGDQMEGVRTRGVRGALTAEEALERLLEGSGFEVRKDPSGAVLIRKAEQEVRPRASGEAREAVTDDVVEFDRIVVTGSNIRGAASAGSNLLVLGSEDIERSGYATIEQFVQTLPQNFAGNVSEQSRAICCGGANNQAFGTAVDLRGLGGDATLTLVDGRRLAPAGIGTFIDVSAIPASAVEQVEILADGASATYGSDAVAGVVNFILRKSVPGPETTLRYATPAGGGREWSFSQLFGAEWQAGSLIAAYERYEKNALPASARRATRSADLRDRGGGDYRVTIANPGTITAIGGQPVVLGIPAGQDGRMLREEELLAGQFNRGDQQRGTNVLPGQERDSVFAVLRQGFGERTEGYATVLWSRRRFGNDNERTGGTTLTVPESNAFRQLNGLFAGQGPLTMAYDLGDDFGPARQTGEAESTSLQTGLQWWLGRSWQADAFVTWARQTDSSERRITDFGALATALASSDLAAAFNPFGDGSHTDPAVLAGLLGHASSRAETEVRSGQVKADGEVARLPGGMLKLAVGAERRKETFEYYDAEFGADGGLLVDYSSSFPARERTVTALFAEAAVPIVGADSRRAGVHALDLSLSVRHEDYSDAGDTLNPKLGLRWQPVESLALRGTWGTSFKAPFFSDIGRPQQGFIVDFPQAIDPEATDGATSTLLLIGGNRDLKPERSRNWTAGFDYEPAWAPRTRLSLTYFDIHFKDRVQAIGNVLGPFLQPDIYRSMFIRNPDQAQVDAYLEDIDEFLGLPPAAGSVEAIIDARQINVAVIDLAGFDLGLSRTAPVRGGNLTLDLNASYLTRYDARITAEAPKESRLNRVGSPVDLRVRGGASYDRGPYRASVFVNYTDSYENPQSTLVSDVDPFVTLDISGSVDLGALLGGGFGRGLVASAAVVNLLDEKPPFVDNREGIGFDPANASALGRMVSFTLRKQW